MMVDTFRKGISFIRKNPTILYSLLLIVAITGVLFINTYYSLRKFQEASDALLKSKAVLAESVFRHLGMELLQTPEILQEKIKSLQNENEDITAIALLTPGRSEGHFQVLASTDESTRGTALGGQTLPYLIAWQDGRISSAFLTSEGGNRSWNVVRKIVDQENRGVGLVLFQLSLAEHDEFVSRTLTQVYGVALGSLILVLLLLGNHLRFFRYALRASKLEEVDRMKEDFIAMASHELKTPLSVLRGYIDLLKNQNEKGQKPEMAGEYLDNMDSSVVRLNSLVDDILNVSRLEQNRLPINIQPVSPEPFLRDLIKQFTVLTAAKGLTLELQYVADPAAQVAADPERLKQIFVNLLGNAVKYTKKGGITLVVKETKKEIVVTVADTGLGLSAEALGHLFSKFYRVKTEETARVAGSGLGLWIAREIARKMGGDVTVESIEGVGSHFNVHLKKYEGSQ